MLYAKFVNGKFANSTNVRPADDDYIEITDDRLLGKILTMASDGTVREQTDDEIEHDFQEFLLDNQLRYLTDRARTEFNESESFIKNDVWENYTKPQKSAVTAYRAALKAISEQTSVIADAVWPVRPTI